jgi:hypothetical protein
MKECIKLFLIKLPVSRQFVVPRNMKLLAVPLSQIHDNAQVSLVITIQHKGFYHLFLSSAASADSFFFAGIWLNHSWNSKLVIEVLLEHHQ